MTALMGLAARLRLSRVYLCTDARQRQRDLAEFLTAAFAGGVDVVQLRQPNLPADAELAALAVARRVAAPSQGLVCVHESVKVAAAMSADLLHLGPAGNAAAGHRQLHRWALVGQSTATPAQIDAAIADPAVDYFWVGCGRAGNSTADLDQVRYAATAAPVGDITAKPWFAAGGITLANLDEVLAAGARRVCVRRAITEAADPEAAAQELQSRLRAAWQADPTMAQYVFQALA